MLVRIWTKNCNSKPLHCHCNMSFVELSFYLSDTDTLDLNWGCDRHFLSAQSWDNQEKQLVLIGLILQTPSADNSAKYSRNKKSARNPQ